MEYLVWEKPCAACGKPFNTYLSQVRKYCHRPECIRDRLRAKRFTIFMRDGFRCCYCGRSSIEDGVKLAIDHLVPKVAGGQDTHDNLATCCEACNASKNSRELDQETLQRIRAEILARDPKANCKVLRFAPRNRRMQQTAPMHGAECNTHDADCNAGKLDDVERGRLDMILAVMGAMSDKE